MTRYGNPARKSVLNLAPAALLAALWAVGCGDNSADPGADSAAAIDTAGPADIAGLDADAAGSDAVAADTTGKADGDGQADAGCIGPEDCPAPSEACRVALCLSGACVVGFAQVHIGVGAEGRRRLAEHPVDAHELQEQSIGLVLKLAQTYKINTGYATGS